MGHTERFFILILLHVKMKKKTHFFKHRIYGLALYNTCCRERMLGGGRGRKLWGMKVRSGVHLVKWLNFLRERMMI